MQPSLGGHDVHTLPKTGKLGDQTVEKLWLATRFSGFSQSGAATRDYNDELSQQSVHKQGGKSGGQRLSAELTNGP